MDQSPGLEIRALRDSDLGSVHELVHDASAIYPLPITPSVEELERIFARRGVDWGASFGAFLDGRLVAVIMTAVDPWPAAHTGAYGVLTAVRKGAQDRGVLSALFDWLKIALERREVTHMQIEALVDDPRARTAYERLGFDGERHLFCFDLPGLSRPQRFIEELSFEVHEGPLALAAQESRGSLWSSFWSLTPAWASSNLTVARTQGLVIFEAAWQGELAGYAALEPDGCELMQLAVREDMRRRGIGTELIRACQQRAWRPTLTVASVDDRDDLGVTICFLRSLGAKLTAVQIEMVLERIY